MRFQKITAIISLTAVDKVCHALKHADVTWITASQQRGHGEHPIYSERDCMSSCMHIEIFIEEKKVKEVVDLLGRTAYEGEESEGMIAIETIDNLIPIKMFKGK
jgi:nitrogen regulatory protein PII